MSTNDEDAKDPFEMRRRREVQGRFATLFLLTVVPVLMVIACFLLFDYEDAKKYAVFSVAIYLTGGTLVILHVVEWWVDHPRTRPRHKGPPHRVLVPAFERPNIQPYDPKKPKASWTETFKPCPVCGEYLISTGHGEICVNCEGIELPPDLYPD